MDGVLNINLEKYKHIEENLQKAEQQIPESLYSRIEMLYIPIMLNGKLLKAFVDTGAQTSIITQDAAQKVGIDTLIDDRISGEAIGVGSGKIVGKIHYTEIVIGSHLVPTSFSVMESMPALDLILGLDILVRYGCDLKLGTKELYIGGEIIKFMSAQEIDKMALISD
mgnify:CR=1 FL=1